MGFGAKAVRIVGELDDIGDAAGRLGESAANVISLGHAFQLTGGNSEDAVKTLQIMERTIGKAVSGSTAASEAFSSLGLSAESLAAMSPVEALKTISDRLADLPSVYHKAAAAQKIFGRGAANNLTSLTAGSAAIGKLQKEAELLGLTFTEKQGQGIGAAQDAIDRMKAAMSGASRTMVVALAPVIERVALFTTKAINVATFIAKNWPDAVNIAGTHIALAFEQWKNDIVFIFQVQIPTAFRNMAMIAVRTFQLAFGQIVNIVVAIQRTINERRIVLPANAFTESAIKGLTAGLEMIPELAVRPIGELEKALTEGLGSSLADFEKRMNDFLSERAALALPPELAELPELPKAASSAISEIATPESPAALLRGSAEAMSAVIKNQQSPMQTSLNKIAELGRKEVELLTRAVEALEVTEGDLELALP